MNKYLNIVKVISRDKIGRIVRKVYRNSKERKKLKNNNFTILSQNCIGSIMYHDLGVKFFSPTINMLFEPKDFLKFLSNVKYYIYKEIEFMETDKKYPVGKIDDIKIDFVHYKSKEEVLEKWNKRRERINWNKLYVIACDDNMSEDDVKKFDHLSGFQKKILFTNNKKHLIKNAIYIYNLFDKADARLLNFCDFSGRRYYQKVFDYVKWINK